ncbi:hypothetical protein Y032_0154g2987 [Ancylostoma ceylanicum]|uniref:Uncharacterized protein n=1 Tax=Ancylostoma ceylanicum TaxID=53326 RepID=A0A016T0A2_9BILA|nr:hypothetical protein Y032_0154g2987 [Ancylostoma ceylanicum]
MKQRWLDTFHADLTLPLYCSRSIALRFAVAGDCEASAHRLWTGRRGGRQFWRLLQRRLSIVGFRNRSPMLAIRHRQH